MAKTPVPSVRATPRYARATSLGFYHMRRIREGEVFRVRDTDTRLAKWMEPATDDDFRTATGAAPRPMPTRTQKVDHQGRVTSKHPDADPDAGEGPTGDQNVLS